MPPKPLRKWRPRLSIIVGAVLLTVLLLPFAAVLLVGAGTGMNAFTPNVTLSAIIVVISVTALIGYVFVRALTGPVQELTQRTEQLRAGDRTALRPLERHGSRELAELSAGLMSMADALFERTDYISSFATHVSHEIKTPLTSMRGAVELILDQGEGMSCEDRQRFLRNILHDTQRITSLLERLRQLAHADNPQERGDTTLSDVMRGLAPRLKDVCFQHSGAVDTRIAMTRENTSIVLSNLIENSIQHQARNVLMHATIAGEMLEVDLSDDGDGISIGNEKRIFDLFFTTRRESGGTGMGLGIVRSMLAAHGGQIDLQRSGASRPGGGTTFRLHFPLV